MFIKTLLVCLLLIPTISQAKQLSHTYKTTYKNFKVVKGYDTLTKQGKISLKVCRTCPEEIFTISKKTVFAENGFEKSINELLQTTLSNKAKHVLVQVNKYTNSVFYIEWGYPEGEQEDSE